MKKVTVKDIMSWKPCKDYPEERIQEIIGEGIKLKEALKLDIPAEDILWLVLRPKFMPEKELHIHACNFAEQALQRERKAGRETHPDSWNAIKVKSLWIDGKVADNELEIAREEAFWVWEMSGRGALDTWTAARMAWMATRVEWTAAWDAAWEKAWEEQLKYLQNYYKRVTM